MLKLFSKFVKSDVNEKLSKALVNLDINQVEKCLKNNADPNHEVGQDGNALVRLLDMHLKVSFCDKSINSKVLACVKLLLEAGSGLESRNSECESPLTLAMIGHAKVIAKYLLEKGANPNARDKKGWTPFLVAIYFFTNDWEFLKLLLEKGAKINHRTNVGETALYMAISQNEFECASFLLKMGANPTLTYSHEKNTTSKISTKDILESKLTTYSQMSSFIKLRNDLAQAIIEWNKKKLVSEIRTYARILNQGFRQNGQPNTHLFMTLPKDPLLEITTYLTHQEDKTFNHTQKINIARRFFNKPPTKKEDIKNESDYVAELLSPSQML